jgi:hypothetical protein
MKLLAIGPNSQSEYISPYEVGEWMENKRLVDYLLFAYSEYSGRVKQINIDPGTPTPLKHQIVNQLLFE